MVPPLFDVECHICSLIHACFMHDLGLHECNLWVVTDSLSACRECLWSDGAKVKNKKLVIQLIFELSCPVVGLSASFRKERTFNVQRAED